MRPARVASSLAAEGGSVKEALEQHPAVRAAEQGRHGSFGVGHQTDDVAGHVGYSRDVATGPVGILLVAKRDLIVRL